jgi:ribonuclease P/MRP protein subunit RPP40
VLISGLSLARSVLEYVRSFLSGSSRQAREGNSLSNATYMSSGVVQGSVWGPLLFLLFVFDDSNSTCKLFADDLKLYTVIRTSEDASKLQSNMDKLFARSETWQLHISYKKCSTMTISNRKTACDCNFYLGIDELNRVAQAKEYSYIGVLIDDSLSFTYHLNSITAKAFARSNLIFKCFTSRDVDTLVHAYKVYVRPFLEYASCVWSPHYIKLVNQTESVQRKFTMQLPGFQSLDYI